MVKRVRSSFIKSSVIALLIGGCTQQPPDLIGLDVFNDASVGSDQVDAPMACTGGVKASLSLAGASVMTPIARPLPAEDNRVGENLTVPPSARLGTPS